ncbi:MAG TPA: hypothetical protein DD670_03095 [Planctomycetaceae bacterium]|nr:hypothetical protein [Planctomycetaceae bacterium]
MSVKLVPEEDLRAALRPHRADVNEFEAGIRARIKAGTKARKHQDSEEQLPLLRVAAAVLPWPLIAGDKVAGGTPTLASVTLAQKLLGYVALPAISLFCLAGAALFSAAKIHGIQKDNRPDIANEEEMRDAVRQWWSRYKWVAWLVFAAVLILPIIGSTWLLFLLLLISFGSLLCVLSGFAKLGVGNRLMIGQSCMTGMVLLGQAMMNPYAGKRDIHFVDQRLITVVLFIGTLILVPFVVSSKKRLGIPGPRFAGRRHWIWGLTFVSIVVPIIMWFTNQIWWPATPSRIKGYVESFPEGPFPSITWRDWEIAASWTIEEGLDPDLSRARRLLADEIDHRTSGSQFPRVLGSAFRVGLVRTDQIDQLAAIEANRQFVAFEAIRQSLIPKASSRQPYPITSLNQQAWVIYALNQSGQLSPEDRDFLERRLLATLDKPVHETGDMLETALRVTQLLDVINRPIDRDQYRERVHQWLRRFHSKKTHFYQIAGGFEQYEGLSSSLQVTSYAVELMEIYGIPDDLDLNWVRSYVRPLYWRPSNDKWIAAVTLDRLNALPGVTQPTWLEKLYYERSLMAAMVLVSLCIYATLSSPNPTIDPSSNHNTADSDVS